jgi:primase-polymerase (primpol)-like protein
MQTRESENKTRPIALPVLGANIPDALKSLVQWVVWKYVAEVDPETGETDWGKPPLCARGGPASSTNSKTWSPFNVALAAYQRGGLDGIGFVLHKKPRDESPGLVGIDLDKCRNPETGAIEPWAQGVIDRIQSYTEASPSDCGIRILTRGKLPAHGRKKGPFEVYETDRYVTVTGHHLDGTPATIEARQAELDEVHRQVFGDRDNAAEDGRQGPRVPNNLDDQQLLSKARACRKTGIKFGRLWDGDTSDYPSRSEADLALVNYLAFWTGGDEARIDELFRASGLFRSKWQREGYRQRTIKKALSGRTDFYDPTYNGHGGNAAGVPQEPPPHQSAEPQRRPHLTDRGNGQRLAAAHGADLLHCFPWHKWNVWDGQRWRVDNTGEVMRLAKEVIVRLFAEAVAMVRTIEQAMQEETGDGGGEG